MKKLAFIMPSVGRKDGEPYVRSWKMEPLQIGVLSAMMPIHYEKMFFDDRLEEIDYDCGADLVMINVETYTARRSYQIAAKFRQNGAKVLMGGYHATLVPDEVLEHADAIVVGESEGLWESILEDFEKDRLQKRYQRDEAMPFEWIEADRSIYADKKYMNLTLVETGRGCRFSCEFCSISSFYRRQYSEKPLDEIVAEIIKQKSKNIFFIDDNLIVDHQRFRKLLEKITPLKLRWVGQISIDVAKDPSLLKLMQKSGCLGVLIGFESLNPKVLEKMGKQVNQCDYDHMLNNLRQKGISVYGTFVFGYDGDDENSFERTYQFSKQHKLCLCAFNHLVPFPGTPLYERLEAENRLLYERWWLNEDYRFGDVIFSPKSMSPEELASLCDKYRDKFYSLDSILIRAFDFRANLRTPIKASIYFANNLTGQREARSRRGLPMGFKDNS